MKNNILTSPEPMEGDSKVPTRRRASGLRAGYRCHLWVAECPGEGDTTIDTGAIDTGAIDTGAIDTGAIDTGAIDTGAMVWEGMVVGSHRRDGDIEINVCQEKTLTNMRSSAADAARTRPDA